MLLLAFSAYSFASEPSAAPADSSTDDFADWHADELMDWCLSALQTGEMSGVDGAGIAYAALTDSAHDGTLIISSGRTETWIKYCEVVYDLRDLEMDIWLIDHRGQGFSERLLADSDKGHVEDFGDYATDLEAFITDVVGVSSSDAVILLGHSMGGMIAAAVTAARPDLIDGLVLSAPMLGLNTDPYPETLSWWIAWGAYWWGYGEDYALGRGPYEDYSFEDNGVTSSLGRAPRVDQSDPAGLTLECHSH